MNNEDISELVRKAHHDGFMARHDMEAPWDICLAEEGAWEASDVIIQMDTLLNPAATYISYKGIYGRFVVTASGMCDGCCYDKFPDKVKPCEHCYDISDPGDEGIFLECTKEEYDASTN